MRSRLAILASLFVVFVLSLSSQRAAEPATPRPLRVLLFSSAASREYQFLRSLLLKERAEKRVDLSIVLQPSPGREKRPGMVQDLPPERLSDAFPTKLDDFDAILALDPDWTRLTPLAQDNLKKWVQEKAGGLVLIAGPIHTMQLTRPKDAQNLARILDLYPVVLRDPRTVDPAIDTSKPRRLHFPETKEKYPFLKLDDKGSSKSAGWSAFFESKDQPEKKDGDPQRGFFSYYPVKSVKSDAVVLATIPDKTARLEDGNEQPFLVTMPVGKGHVVYLSSGETWRLRPMKAEYHRRFWLELLKNVTK